MVLYFILSLQRDIRDRVSQLELLCFGVIWIGKSVACFFIADISEKAWFLFFSIICSLQCCLWGIACLWLYESGRVVSYDFFWSIAYFLIFFIKPGDLCFEFWSVCWIYWGNCLGLLEDKCGSTSEWKEVHKREKFCLHQLPHSK